MTLTEKVNAINDMLRSFGGHAVQKIEMKNKDGQVIGMVRYGYKPQYIFDAVNQHIGPENWRYELVKEEIFESQAVAEVRLFLKTDAEWLCKGSHKGQMQIVKGNVGDAQKGAITDAIQKCFSLISVGQDSYRGLLGSVFNSSSQSRPPAKPSQSKPPAPQPQPPPASPTPPANTPAQPNLFDQQQDPFAALPHIAGVTYQRVGDKIVAIGEKLFEKKEMLKSIGFKWSSGDKNWFQPINH